MQVVVRDASVRFGERVVFSGFNADFRSGRTTALVGPSGSGKSTLLSAVAGYRRLDSGSIRVGSSASEAPSPEIVAWVPQGANALSSRSVVDNVAIGALATGASLELAREVSMHWLQVVGLASLSLRRARELSGGELQRLALARALASERPLILADEPSANLDQANTENVAELFASLRSTKTIIVATHDPLIVSKVDDVVEMRAT